MKTGSVRMTSSVLASAAMIASPPEQKAKPLTPCVGDIITLTAVIPGETDDVRIELVTHDDLDAKANPPKVCLSAGIALPFFGNTIGHTDLVPRGGKQVEMELVDIERDGRSLKSLPH